MGDSYLASRWMDELLIFAAMSVASSLGCLHVIMLDNEEMGKSIGRYSQFLSEAHSSSCSKAFWDSSLSSGSWIIRCIKNLTLKTRKKFTVTICQKSTRLQIKYIHLNSAETDRTTDRSHHTSNHNIIWHQVRPSSSIFKITFRNMFLCKICHICCINVQITACHIDHIVIVAHCVHFSFIFRQLVNLSKPKRADSSAERNLSASITGKYHMVTKMEFNLKRHFA